MIYFFLLFSSKKKKNYNEIKKNNNNTNNLPLRLKKFIIKLIRINFIYKVNYINQDHKVLGEK